MKLSKSSVFYNIATDNEEVIMYNGIYEYVKIPDSLLIAATEIVCICQRTKT